MGLQNSSLTERPTVFGFLSMLQFEGLAQNFLCSQTIQLFLWNVSVHQFCHLPSVFDSLSDAIISQGKSSQPVLAGVAQQIEHQPHRQGVAGSIPSPGTCLGCGPGPQLEARERQPHFDVSLPLLLPPFSSKNK